MAIDQALQSFIRTFDQVVVAFSGGVDSAVVANATQLAIGERAIAITARSPSVASGEVESAIELATQIGIKHVVVETHEIDDTRYVRNTGDRCFWCKNELYDQIENWIGTQHAKNEIVGQSVVIFNGTNTDDLGDYGPGLKSAAQHSVVSPLVACGINKQNVRELAKQWNLPVWNKPAGPCLASHIAPGQLVTVERLAMIDKAESSLREHGFEIVRVRYHENDLARIEVSMQEIMRLKDPTLHDSVLRFLMSLGFRKIEIDERGFRSGSLNDLIPLAGRQSSNF